MDAREALNHEFVKQVVDFFKKVELREFFDITPKHWVFKARDLAFNPIVFVYDGKREIRGRGGATLIVHRITRGIHPFLQVSEGRFVFRADVPFTVIAEAVIKEVGNADIASVPELLAEEAWRCDLIVTAMYHMKQVDCLPIVYNADAFELAWVRAYLGKNHPDAVRAAKTLWSI